MTFCRAGVIGSDTQDDRICAAISAGAKTSRDIANVLDTTRERITVALSALEEDGRINRAGTRVNRQGPPSILWKVAAK